MCESITMTRLKPATVRRVIVNVRRTAKRSGKFVAKTAVYSVVPSIIDDVTLHHASLSIHEIQNVATDVFVSNAIGIVLKALIV